MAAPGRRLSPDGMVALTSRLEAPKRRSSDSGGGGADSRRPSAGEENVSPRSSKSGFGSRLSAWFGVSDEETFNKWSSIKGVDLEDVEPRSDDDPPFPRRLSPITQIFRPASTYAPSDQMVQKRRGSAADGGFTKDARASWYGSDFDVDPTKAPAARAPPQARNVAAATAAAAAPANAASKSAGQGQGGLIGPGFAGASSAAAPAVAGKSQAAPAPAAAPAAASVAPAAATAASAPANGLADRRTAAPPPERLKPLPLKDAPVNPKAKVVQQLAHITEKRPYFTYYMAFCQIVVLAVALGLYGFSTISFLSTSLAKFERVIL